MNAEGVKVRKRTGAISNFVLRRTVRQCECSEVHGDCQGYTADGLMQTRLLAVYPPKLCDALLHDASQARRASSVQWHWVLYTCPRCSAGRAATDEEHSMQPGECRFGQPHLTGAPSAKRAASAKNLAKAAARTAAAAQTAAEAAAAALDPVGARAPPTNMPAAGSAAIVPAIAAQGPGTPVAAQGPDIIHDLDPADAATLADPKSMLDGNLEVPTVDADDAELDWADLSIQ